MGDFGVIPASSIYAYLGRHNLDSMNEDFAVKENITELLIHPDWDLFVTTSDADVALLKTEYFITFTDYIQPICLPTATSSLFNLNGFAVGYKRSQNESVDNKRPQQIEIKSLNQEHCLQKNPVLVAFSSARTFCAGEEGSNLCK